jgi:hypothetical protein
MHRVEAILAAACLLAAGCIGTVSADAMDTRDQADERAQEVAPDAELLSVNALEVNETPGERNGESFGPSTFVDDRIGDGSPAAWVYEYRTDNGSLDVTVNADGEIVRVDRSETPQANQTALGDWSVSSTEAVEIVQENNATWTVDDEGAAFYNLERDDPGEDPIWSVGQSVQDGFLGARVNAETGAFLGANEFDSNFSIGPVFGGDGGGERPDQPPRRGDTYEGSVSAAETTEEHEFALGNGHDELGVRLALDGQSAGSLTATVEGPQGELGTLSVGADSAEDADTWEDIGEGEYTITVEYDAGVQPSYTGDWCAEGFSTGDTSTEEACDRVEDATDGDRVADLAPVR